MKKSFVFLFSIFSLFLFILAGCSHKNQDESEITINESLNNYMYIYTLDSLKDENSILSKGLNSIFKRYIIKDGIFYSFFDLLFPGRINQFNTFYFYDLYNDDCYWVDAMIMELEEQRIANQLIEMENRLEDIITPIDEKLEKEEAEENEAEIRDYVKNEVSIKDNNLGYMEYGDEKFIPQIVGENYILIHSYNENVSRNFYDKLFRCYKKESWKISSNNEELLYTTNISFDDNSYIPKTSTTITKETKQHRLFNDKGQVKEEVNYIIYDNKEYIKSSLKLKYNSDNKIIESNLTEYNYDGELYSKLLYTFNKKYIYKFNGDDIPADFDYYENNILKMRNRYSSEDTYTSRIYFNDGYSVLSYYQNNIPVKEVYSVNDVVERVKVYE